MTTAERSSFAVARLHRPAFYAAVVAGIGLFAVMLGELLPLAATAWVTDTGPHRLHDLNVFALIWLAVLGLAAQLHRPDRRVTAAVVPTLVMVPLAVLAVTAGSPIAPMPVLFTVVGLVVLALHPAGRSVLTVRRVEAADRFSSALVIVAVVPLAVYAVDQLAKQYTLVDDHAALVHYGGMGLLALVVTLLAALSVWRRRDWRFAAWGAGALAVYLGASSVAFSDLSSSAGPLWGGLAVAWGLAFVAAVETSRGAGPVRVSSSIDIEAPIGTVWAVTTDIASFVEGIDWVYDARWEEGSGPREGAVYVERAKPGLREGTYRWEITACEPPTRIVHSHAGGEIEADLEVRLEELEGGTTRYTQVMDFRALPAFRPLGFVLERTVMRRAMRRDFDRMILPNYRRFAEERAAAGEEEE